MSFFRPKHTARISAARMAVRPDVGWPWRIARVAAALAIGAGGVWALAQVSGAGMRERELAAELSRLREKVERQEAELAELRPKATQADRQNQIERAAAGDLAKQVKSLSFENAALKEDLAFFQTLMTTGESGRDGAISVNRFRLKPEPVAGEYRSQMLLVQPGQRVREFRGTLQFVLDVQQDGHKLVLVLPPDTAIAGGDAAAAADYRLNFRFFQRVEGTFKLTPGSVLRGMEVRVFENGARTPKLTQRLDVS
jgi:hypothetical protein